MTPRMTMSMDCKHAQHQKCQSTECWCICHPVAPSAQTRAEAAEAEVIRLQTEMTRLTKVWLASPEAAKRLDGYRELGAKCAELEGTVVFLQGECAKRQTEIELLQITLADLRKSLANLFEEPHDR